MVTVEADVDRVECRLAAGELSCPSCGGVLAGWGRARPRQLRGPAQMGWWSCAHAVPGAPVVG